ncbi:hypothetical protein CIRG_02018 [Coccidioides immitis RMSCC 2394]|uniref:Uncharacterized protein n=1 Tax=Coccidioides immitis RMSCC 2394 TaxID=404692 RepID=A0A0J6Y2E3_COCIT|nr:hypothetical protein CIRG_02018 [Coccidioides immitis RMSCC 2394]
MSQLTAPAVECADIHGTEGKQPVFSPAWQSVWPLWKLLFSAIVKCIVPSGITWHIPQAREIHAVLWIGRRAQLGVQQHRHTIPANYTFIHELLILAMVRELSVTIHPVTTHLSSAQSLARRPLPSQRCTNPLF